MLQESDGEEGGGGVHRINHLIKRGILCFLAQTNVLELMPWSKKWGRGEIPQCGA